MKTQKILGCALALTLMLNGSVIHAYEQGQIIVRAGPANVNPDSSSGLISLDSTPLAGTSVDVEDDTQLGITATYMIRENWGVSLLASTPYQHDIVASGLGVADIGSTKHLPPTLTLQYYPSLGTDKISAYVGLGANYTTFFSETTSQGLNAALGNTSLSLDDSFGLALEAGADFKVNEKWAINASVWMIDIDTDATITSDAGTATVSVQIDPVAYMLGLSYTF